MRVDTDTGTRIYSSMEAITQYTIGDLLEAVSGIPVLALFAPLVVFVLMTAFWVAYGQSATGIQGWLDRRRLRSEQYDLWTRPRSHPVTPGAPAVFRGQKGTWIPDGPVLRFYPGRVSHKEST